MIKLLPFNDSDISQLTAMIPDERFLLQWAGPKYNFPLDESQIKETMKRSEDEFPSCQILKAVHEEKTIGHLQLMDINYQSSTCVLGRVLIFPEFMGKGFGLEMVRLSIIFAFENIGLNEITLNVFDFNIRAIETYKKAGFIEYQFKKGARRFRNELWDIVKMRIQKNI